MLEALVMNGKKKTAKKKTAKKTVKKAAKKKTAKKKTGGRARALLVDKKSGMATVVSKSQAVYVTKGKRRKLKGRQMMKSRPALKYGQSRAVVGKGKKSHFPFAVKVANRRRKHKRNPASIFNMQSLIQYAAGFLAGAYVAPKASAILLKLPVINKLAASKMGTMAVEALVGGGAGFLIMKKSKFKQAGQSVIAGTAVHLILKAMDKKFLGMGEDLQGIEDMSGIEDMGQEDIGFAGIEAMDGNDDYGISGDDLGAFEEMAGMDGSASDFFEVLN